MAKKKKTEQNKVNTDGSVSRKAPVKGAALKPKNEKMLFEMEHVKIFLSGLLIILVGIALMSGGSMPSPDVWDESIIYSARRTVIAPIFILAGLIIQVYGILKKN